MGTKFSQYKRVLIVTLWILILISGCFGFKTIVQPDVADPNSSFEVPITVYVEEIGYDQIPFFGILLPEGWLVDDNISCTGVYSGILGYSSDYSDSMEAVDSAPDGYYWWVSVGSYADSINTGICSFTPRIHTDSQTGTFFIDYILGYNDSICARRSNNHPISVGMPMTATVTNTNDSGEGSLRQAMMDVSSSGEIVFDLTYPATITLDSQLVVDRNLTITGPTSGTLTISGNNAVRVFNINGDLNVNMSDLTISNGNAGGENGGGILIEADLVPDTLTLTNVTISGNTAANGGGIYCRQSNLILSNVNISRNNSSYGGGIYCDNSSLSLTSVTISENDGSGIYYDNSISSLIDVTISENGGGGIYCGGNSSPSLTNVIISENDGVGISFIHSSPSLKNVTISGNTADDEGGGIYCDNSSPSLSNVTISGNTAVNGGGIYCRQSNLILSNVNISRNNSSYGGGIYCRNSSLNFDSVNRCNIFLNSAIPGPGCDLYAINCDTIDVIVDTFTVLQPYDYFAYPIDNFTFDILNKKIEPFNQDLYVSPTGSDYNSGLTVEDPLLTISYALIKILADSTNPLTIHLLNGTYSPSQTGEIFPLNCRSYVSLVGEDDTSTILDGEGLKGILWCKDDNNFSIENMTIQNGFSEDGGGIYCENSSPSLKNVTISGNTADDEGGGIYCDNSSPSLTSVTVIENMASSASYNRGGGIYCRQSNLILSNVNISRNNSSYGGGISCDNSSLSLTNVTISENDGSGINCYNSSSNLTNVTISGNTAYGISCDTCSLSLVNCILWSDTTGEIYSYLGNIVTATYSDIQGGWSGIGNIEEDPVFVSGPLSDYHLCPSTPSPCIDAGNPDAQYNDPEDTLNPGYAMWPALGTIRNDMGAYGGPGTEFWTSVEEEDDEDFIPTSFNLMQNYPNPFSRKTNINYTLPKASRVNLKFYDISGRLVSTLVNNFQNAGVYNVTFDGSKLASGIYFYYLKAGEFIETKKMILVR